MTKKSCSQRNRKIGKLNLFSPKKLKRLSLFFLAGKRKKYDREWFILFFCFRRESAVRRPRVSKTGCATLLVVQLTRSPLHSSSVPVPAPRLRISSASTNPTEHFPISQPRSTFLKFIKYLLDRLILRL